jgi:hypothetical protein
MMQQQTLQAALCLFMERKNMKIIERLVNTETNETIDIERAETTQETAERLENEAIFEAQQKAREEAQVKRSVALAKLEALGLDEADLKALGL